MTPASEISAHSHPSRRDAAKPLVSVVIPYYNQETFVEATVRSVEAQSYPNIEIIVVDDGSPIPLPSTLQERDGLTLLRTQNGGCPAARNAGFKQSSGEFLLFLDSDDHLVPGAIEAHLETLTQKPEAAFSFGAVQLIDEHDRVIRGPHLCRRRKNYFPMLLECNPIATPGSVMIRRSIFLAAGMWDESFRIVEDYRFYLWVARRYPIAQLDQCVAEYRLHSTSGSQDKEAMLRVTMRALDKVEEESELSATERRRLQRGRKRWEHTFRPSDSLSYKLKNMYFKAHAMWGVPIRSYFG